MATSGSYRTNEESCEALQADFIDLAAAGNLPPWQWMLTWQRLIDDRWLGF